MLCFDEQLHKTELSSHPLSIWRDISIYFLIRRLSHQVFNNSLSQCLTIQWILWLQVINQWTTVDLVISPFSNTYDHIYLQKSCLLWQFSFTNAFHGCPRKGVRMLNCSLLATSCIACRTIYKPGPNFFFLNQLHSSSINYSVHSIGYI